MHVVAKESPHGVVVAGGVVVSHRAEQSIGGIDGAFEQRADSSLHLGSLRAGQRRERGAGDFIVRRHDAPAGAHHEALPFE